jgi:predicted house-cleaning noncanonical NTP pyrophosphatase (MazG superfamily)
MHPSVPLSGDEMFSATPSFRPRGLRSTEASEAGGKGAGLLRLPPDWYPPTLVLQPRVHSAHSAGLVGDTFLSESSQAETYARYLAELTALGTSGEVFVRSSALGESMSERGRYESLSSESSLAAVERTILGMWNSLDDGVKLGVLIEPHLDVKVRGHLSNEHRISRDTTSWAAETYVGTDVKTETWRVTGASVAADQPLLAARISDLEPVLRRVAKFFSALPFRHHLEWVWDGDRIWIVQADRVPPLVGYAPGDAWASQRGRTVPDDKLAVWTRLTGPKLDEYADWNKVAAVREFFRADLPIGTVWALAGAETIESISHDIDVPGLTEDIELLASGDVVVRTDVRNGGEKLFLPKTGTLTDPSDVTDFIRSTSQKLINDGVPAADIAFLLHRYVRARACAWTLASPNDAWVEVDSMWGLPDGLAWLPHDSAWVNVETSEVSRSIEGKTNFLDVDELRNWTYRESPTEWIWRASMSEDQLRTISAGAWRLAKDANHPVLTMWFIGILDGGDAEYLPWFQLEPVGESQEDHAQVSPTTKRTLVSTEADIDALVGAVPFAAPRILRLRPIAELVRDTPFLDKVIAFALEHDIPVELTGSRLAHPFYILKSAGVSVSCVGDTRQPSTSYNKLVRDQIVQKIESSGEEVVSYRAAGTERTKLLRLKLLEEALELLQTSTTEQAIDEFADVEEVLGALRVALGVRRSDVRTRRTEKRSARGGFDDGRVLVSSGRRFVDPGQNELEGVFDAGSGYRPWQVQQHSDRLSVSLVPPLFGEQRTFVLRIGAREVHLTYRGAALEIWLNDIGDETSDQMDTLF